MVEVKNLNLSIKKRKILKDINISISSGEILGIIGDNGSGKTLLLKCISGLIKCTQGEVCIDGKVLGTETEFPQSMGLLIENPEFIPYLSGYENLEILAAYKNIVAKKEIINTMELVGLDPKLKRKVKNYSLGMRQRLGIAQAIMENPKLLILDEPFNSIDKKGVDDIRKLLLNMKEKGTCIIITSHNQQDIDILCDRIYAI